MAKIPAPRKTAKPVAKKAAARPAVKKAVAPKKVVATGSKKKKIDIAPGTSPWERKAIKKGSQYFLSAHDEKMHKEFVSGKKHGWSDYNNGKRQITPMGRMKIDQISTNKKNEGSYRAKDGAYGLGYAMALTNKTQNNGQGIKGNQMSVWKTLKKNSRKAIMSNTYKSYDKKGNK